MRFFSDKDRELARASRARRPKGLNLRKVIRTMCLDCCYPTNTSPEVRLCPVTSCPLWGFRLGREVLNPKIKRVCRARSLKDKCFDCRGGSRQEAAMCDVESCPIWQFRVSLPADHAFRPRLTREECPSLENYKEGDAVPEARQEEGL